MTESCVLDTSVVARWWLPSKRPDLDAAARGFLTAFGAGALKVHVPTLLYVAASNVFSTAVRFEGWPAAAAEQALSDLLELGLVRCPNEAILHEAQHIAVDHQVTVYDAVYVELAHRLGVPLYTADDKLGGVPG